jgi:hypothetical protein
MSGLNIQERVMSEVIWDVVVVGGGMAGCGAAWAAAKNGAKTLLIERYGYLGGWATAALVNPFMSSNTSDGKPLVGGFFSELKDELAKVDGGILGSCFDPEWMKIVLQEMVLGSGAEMLLHSCITGVQAEDDGISLKVFCKAGERTVRCRRVVDCSGDGDVAISLGAEFETGDETGVAQAVTLMFDVGGVDLVEALEYVKANPDQMRFPKMPADTDIQLLTGHVLGIAGYYDLVSQAKSRGEYPVPGDLVFYVTRPRLGEVTFNTTHVGDVDGIDLDALTRAEIEGRRQMVAVLNFARSSMPGFKNSYILRSPSHVGVRESRRVMGKYVFDASDIATSSKFDDAICRLAYWVDIHKGKGTGYTRSEEKEKIVEPVAGDYYEIPYRSLVPNGVENVLLAGRCISSTQGGHAAIRIMPCCAALGQAAGTAAALSVKTGTPVGEIDITTLKETLRSDGALV